ncbi:hypothetical protein [Pseudoteredinibacter isoporae]|uniref:hypothetical protein n=1 Tax=Pseudoteredinibacter isoporae TaxID=570281 RepID=UPI00310432ED
MPIAKRVHWKGYVLRLLSDGVFYVSLVGCLGAVLVSTVQAAEYGIVTRDRVTVYQGPGEHFAVVTRLKQGKMVSRRQVRDNWTEIRFTSTEPNRSSEQQRAWIRSEFIAVDPVSRRLGGRAEKTSQTQSSSVSTAHTARHFPSNQPVSINLEDEQLNCQKAEGARIRLCNFSLRFGLRSQADITRAKVRCESEFRVEVFNGEAIEYHWHQEQVYRIEQGSGVFSMATALKAKKEFEIENVSVQSRHCSITAFGRSTNN